MNFPFKGRHLLVTFYDCSLSALLDVETLQKQLEFSAKCAGANQLDLAIHPFPNGGYTSVLLLSESHVSIHTYPEHRSCFMDFFTCGENADGSLFFKLMHDYLKPEKVDQMTIQRGSGSFPFEGALDF